MQPLTKEQAARLQKIKAAAAKLQAEKRLAVRRRIEELKQENRDE
jgi:hypothetical protein